MHALRVNNLGKAYKSYPTRWARLLEWLVPFSPRRHELKWVLQDIGFEVPAGEAVGIVGVNGAGKSTLLKMITGTTQPTTGSVELSGRVAALLELGMGFHPDFTGRENVFMSGQLLGYSIEELNVLMPEIEEFADIGDYIDMPVRVYSSGMQVRLAFSVATARRPDVLIVDEALAVGDAAFQRKCFRRIEKFREDGTTLLLVTHDVDCVKKICDNAIFLKDGRLEEYGKSKIVCDAYEKMLFGGSKEVLPTALPEPVVDPSLMSTCEEAYGDGRAIIENIWLESPEGNTANVLGSCDPLVLKYRVRFSATVEGIVFAFMIKTKDGVALFGMDTTHLPEMKTRTYEEGSVVQVSFNLSNVFAPGVYYINCGVRDDDGELPVFLHRRVDACLFRVRQDERTSVRAGLVNTPATFSLEAG